jgi:hypothetical protein
MARLKLFRSRDSRDVIALWIFCSHGHLNKGGSILAGHTAECSCVGQPPLHSSVTVFVVVAGSEPIWL